MLTHENEHARLAPKKSVLSPRKTILFFCHRFLELRFLIASRMLDHMVAQARVVVMLPPGLIESVRSFLPEGAEIRAANYPRAAGGKALRNEILRFIDGVLYHTYANTDRLPNASAEFHRRHYIHSTRRGSQVRSIGARLKIAAARLCSKSRATRRLFGLAYYYLTPANIHADEIRKMAPDLVAGCSFGMGLADGAFLVEARRLGIPSVVIAQGWDRTSNKGFPTIHPNFAIVWNEVMRSECITNLEFASDRVFVEGAPIWDRHFSREGLISEAEWRRQLGIASDRKVIFYACGGFGGHSANMQIVPQVLSLAEEQRMHWPLHVVFRLYPQYYAPDSEWGAARHNRNEIEALLARYEGKPDISIARPKVVFDGENFMPSEDDQTFMLSCLAHCDVSLSQLSSQMIEACIFGKPAINIAYGRRKNERYDIPVGDYLTEHLLRIYRVNAIYQASDFQSLCANIAEALEHPSARAIERQRLLDQEAPVNRGMAARKTAQRLVQLASADDSTCQNRMQYRATRRIDE